MDDWLETADRLADLIDCPAEDVTLLLARGREFTVAEIVIMAEAIGRDWRPILLRAANRTLN